MRQLWIAVGFVVACGGGSGDDDTPVTELSSTSQVDLCERFLDGICANPDTRGFCEDPCIVMGCAAAVDAGHVVMQCATAPGGGPITAGMVEECASAATLAVCTEGGGCMFDALEATCP